MRPIKKYQVNAIATAIKWLWKRFGQLYQVQVDGASVLISDVIEVDLSDRFIQPHWCEHRGADLKFLGVSIDSRLVEKDQLFVALAGTQVDGHAYITETLAQGVRRFMVTKRWAEHQLAPLLQQYPQACFLLVEDTRAGLAQLAQAWRAHLNLPWVAVTGSCGKTTVKEMLACVLSTQGRTIATLGNQNNELGAPLTLLRADASYAYGVAELGANHVGEIANTVSWVRPKIAILNNVNPAHLEGFGSLDAIAKAKSEIFSTLTASDYAVVNRDDPFYDIFLHHIKAYAKQGEVPHVITFGEHPQSMYRLMAYEPGPPAHVTIKVGSSVRLFKLGLLGKHNAVNALACLAGVDAFSIELDVSLQALEMFQPIGGRLKPYQVNDALFVLDDGYNANPAAVKQAIEVLAGLEGKRVLVLGDMLELGSAAEAEHRCIGRLAADHPIDCLVACGPLMVSAFEVFAQARAVNTPQAQWGVACETTDAALAWLFRYFESLGKQRINVLIKGSRSMGMERVRQGLLSKYE